MTQHYRNPSPGECFGLLISYQRFALSPAFHGSAYILKHYTLMALRFRLQGHLQLPPKFSKISITFGTQRKLILTEDIMAQTQSPSTKIYFYTCILSLHIHIC